MHNVYGHDCFRYKIWLVSFSVPFVPRRSRSSFCSEIELFFNQFLFKLIFVVKIYGKDWSIRRLFLRKEAQNWQKFLKNSQNSLQYFELLSQ